MKRCGPKLDTKERLFGQAMPETPKKKLNDTFRSSIFSDIAPSSPVKTPKKMCARVGKKSDHWRGEDAEENHNVIEFLTANSKDMILRKSIRHFYAF
ncbi:hypothetical protein niasHS_005011 [Heterodera schachtii]|uniref:Uncharacterized protein n=1 Tax=Heterodera schachtii TaxID=97005 RepID=A0ABD2HRM9_HETSC